MDAILDNFGPKINNFINKITLQKEAGNDFATLVFPIISMGSGKQVGAIEITTSPVLVNQTQAVIQLEGSLLESFRVRALVPSDSQTPLKFNRVQRVGLSALREQTRNWPCRTVCFRFKIILN